MSVERRRTEQLLADALELLVEVAKSAGFETTPEAVLEMLAARHGYVLAREHELNTVSDSDPEPLLVF